jgi:hypothetical protein
VRESTQVTLVLALTGPARAREVFSAIKGRRARVLVQAGTAEKPSGARHGELQIRPCSPRSRRGLRPKLGGVEQRLLPAWEWRARTPGTPVAGW